MTMQKFKACIQTLKKVISFFNSDEKNAQLFSQQIIAFLNLAETELSLNEKAMLLIKISELKVLTPNHTDREIVDLRYESIHSNTIVNLAMQEVCAHLSQHEDTHFVAGLLLEQNKENSNLGLCLALHQDSPCITAYLNLLLLLSDQQADAVLLTFRQLNIFKQHISLLITNTRAIWLHHPHDKLNAFLYLTLLKKLTTAQTAPLIALFLTEASSKKHNFSLTAASYGMAHIDAYVSLLNELLKTVNPRLILSLIRRQNTQGYNIVSYSVQRHPQCTANYLTLLNTLMKRIPPQVSQLLLQNHDFHLGKIIAYHNYTADILAYLKLIRQFIPTHPLTVMKLLGLYDERAYYLQDEKLGEILKRQANPICLQAYYEIVVDTINPNDSATADHALDLLRLQGLTLRHLKSPTGIASWQPFQERLAETIIDILKKTRYSTVVFALQEYQPWVNEYLLRLPKDIKVPLLNLCQNIHTPLGVYCQPMKGLGFPLIEPPPKRQPTIQALKQTLASNAPLELQELKTMPSANS